MQTASPDPVFINLEYFFFIVLNWLGEAVRFIFSREFITSLRFFVTILVILLITATLYSLVRLYEIEQQKKKKTQTPKSVLPGMAAPVSLPQVQSVVPTAEGIKNPVWENIRGKLLSENPSDWRLGIIEADIYLDRVLDDKGFHGETMGDKLKQVPTGDLASLSLAWEGHKIRNKIAHQGEGYTLTMPEARRTLSYFEIVFRDLGVIE